MSYHYFGGHYDPYAQHEAELEGWLPAYYSYGHQSNAHSYDTGTYYDSSPFNPSSGYEEASRIDSRHRSTSHNHGRGYEPTTHSSHRRGSSSVRQALVDHVYPSPNPHRHRSPSAHPSPSLIENIFGTSTPSRSTSTRQTREEYNAKKREKYARDTEHREREQERNRQWRAGNPEHYERRKGKRRDPQWSARENEARRRRYAEKRDFGGNSAGIRPESPRWYQID